VIDDDGGRSGRTALLPSTPSAGSGAGAPTTSSDHIELVERYSAHNYHPLPIVVSSAEGVWVTDVEGAR
jgi:ornithine--oxo-acid transaminase